MYLVYELYEPTKAQKHFLRFVLLKGDSDCIIWKSVKMVQIIYKMKNSEDMLEVGGSRWLVLRS